MTEQTGLTFEQVSKAALEMLSQGVTPTVRGILRVTGGKTETASKLLRDFNEKRNAEVLKMADELGSSAIAKLLADEMQNVVDRKTANLQEIIDSQKEQLNEVIELLAEKEKDCQHRVEMAEAKAIQSINEADERATGAEERIESAELMANNARIEADQAKQEASNAIAAAEEKSDLLIENAKREASALVEAADRRAEKLEQEAAGLRDQVRLLSIDEAKRELEAAQHERTIEEHTNTLADLAELRTLNVKLQTQHESQVTEIERLSGELKGALQANEQHNNTLTELADSRTQNVKLQTQQESLATEVERLSGDLEVARADGKQLASAQGQLVELQNQLNQVQNALTLSERERESLSLALRKQD